MQEIQNAWVNLTSNQSPNLEVRIAFYFVENSKFKPKDALSIKSINDKCNVWCERLWDAVLMECGHGGVWYEWALTSIKFDDRCYFCRNIISCILQVIIYLCIKWSQLELICFIIGWSITK